MQIQKKSSQHVYDYVIVGGGLSGLLVASGLSQNTANILLLDRADSFGGHNRPIQTRIGTVNNGLRLLPANELTQKALSFLEPLLGTQLQSQTIDLPPVTFESGAIKPFVGFGDLSPSFYEELAYFIQSQRLQMNLEPHEWTQLLFNNFRGEFLPRSHVTKFHGENGHITSATINGQKTVHALNFIYCGELNSLPALLPEDGLSARARQKMSKSKFWTAVCLDLLHQKAVTDSKSLHILNGTTQDDSGPCIGLFHAPTELNEDLIQFSQWISFVENQGAEDSESIAHSLKKIKKQIKRAYPEAFEKILQERILVVPSIGGDGELKLNSNQSLPAYPNFWIGSGTVHQQKNLLGTLLQAELVCSALGCHPMGVQVETAQHMEALAESPFL